eukprot:symbB.v1.2.024799.t1/scaffold2373.1/size80819/1
MVGLKNFSESVFTMDGRPKSGWLPAMVRAEEHVSPKLTTKLLGRLRLRGDLGRLQQALLSLESNNLQVNAFHYTSLMSAFEKLGLIASRCHVVPGCEALRKQTRWQRPLSIADSMKQKQVALDAVSRNVVLAACAAGAQWDLALNCWAAAPATQRGCNALLLSFERAKASLAQGFLRRMPSWKVYPNQNSYGTCMRAAGRLEDWPCAICLLQEMQVVALLPSLVAVSCALNAMTLWNWTLRLLQMSPWLDAVAVCAAVSTFQQWHSGMALMSHLKQQQVQTDVFSTNALLSAAERASAWKEALVIAPRNDEVSISCVLSACAGAGYWELAFQCLNELMPRSLGTTNPQLHKHPGTVANLFCFLLHSVRQRLSASDVTLNAATSAAQQGNVWRSALFWTRGEDANSLLGACGRGRAWTMALHVLRARTAGRLGRAATLDACAKRSHWQFAVVLLDPCEDAVALASVAMATERCGLRGSTTMLLEQLATHGLRATSEKLTKLTKLCYSGTLWHGTLAPSRPKWLLLQLRFLLGRAPGLRVIPKNSQQKPVSNSQHLQRANVPTCIFKSAMFDFDELEDAEVPKPEPEPTELPQAASEKVPERVEPEVDASTASPVEEPKEMPNAKYSPGMVLECVGQLLMRQQEDLESPQVARLPQKSLVKVLEVGTGPSGKRVKVHAASGEEGWASVIASNTAPMFRSTERPFALEKSPVAVAAVPAAAPVEPAATATVEPVASAPSATVTLAEVSV